MNRVKLVWLRVIWVVTFVWGRGGGLGCFAGLKVDGVTLSGYHRKACKLVPSAPDYCGLEVVLKVLYLPGGAVALKIINNLVGVVQRMGTIRSAGEIAHGGIVAGKEIQLPGPVRSSEVGEVCKDDFIVIGLII